MDLSKAFDCVNHELLIAKLSAYGFSKNALLFIHSYLSERAQRVQIETEHSSYRCLKIGVPQGSILGPLLFNIYINDLFFDFIDSSVHICNYADDNTLYTMGKNMSEIVEDLKMSMQKVNVWFKNNGLQLNVNKCELIVLGKNRIKPISFSVNDILLKEVDHVKLLGVIIDNNLSFTQHANVLCRKIGAKLSALKRIASYLSEWQRKIIATSFVISETNYCPLVWAFASRGSNKKLQRLQERTMSLIQIPEYVSLHRRNCEQLLKEVYKTKNDLNPSYMKDVFNFKNCRYETRRKNTLERNPIHTTNHGLQSVSNIASQLWDSLPNDIKNSSSLSKFSSQIKSQKSLQCKCRICATFISSLGYID